MQPFKPVLLEAVGVPDGHSIASYKNFKLHLGVRLVARDDQGVTARMFWLRTVAERKGRFKIYSTDD